MQHLITTWPTTILASFLMELLSLGRLYFRLNQAVIVFVTTYQYH